jgi:hypothetical protein
VSSGPGEPAAPAIVVLLDRLAEWQAHEGEPIEAALGAIEDEERSARRRLEDAQRQAAALASLRREQEELRHQLEMESLRRRRDGVRDALAVDRSLLEARAGELLELLAARDRELGLLLAAPALAPAVSGYLDATDRLAGARGTGAPAPEDLLPPEDRALLEPYLRAAIAPPPSLGAPPAGVGVVISTDPPQGRPEALLVVLPVPWSVYAGATSRPEDLCTLLAYRLVAAVHALLGEVGAAEAVVRFADLHGSLALQVWLGDTQVVPDLRDRLLEGVAGSVEGAPELNAAGIEVYAVWLTPDILMESGA